MHTQTLPHFSEFQLLRLTNPTCFYAAETQEQMKAARAFHGTKAFYDHMAKGGGSFEIEL